LTVSRVVVGSNPEHIDGLQVICCAKLGPANAANKRILALCRYQTLYEENGSKNSMLTILPFNQASKCDVDAVVSYIYDTEKCDLDFVIPFAAIPENGNHQ
jgi:hypothetical protein